MINEKGITEAIQAAITKSIEEAMDEEIKAAQERLKLRIRKDVSIIATSLLNHFSIERIGPELVIRVKFEEVSR